MNIRKRSFTLKQRQNNEMIALPKIYFGRSFFKKIIDYHFAVEVKIFETTVKRRQKMDK